MSDGRIRDPTRPSSLDTMRLNIALEHLSTVLSEMISYLQFYDDIIDRKRLLQDILVSVNAVVVPPTLSKKALEEIKRNIQEQLVEYIKMFD